MAQNNIDKALEIIENSRFFNNHGWNHHRISGSSTVVYPITHWVPNREITIQIDREKYRGRTQAARKLMRELEPVLDINSWVYIPNDGSCPPELVIFYNK